MLEPNQQHAFTPYPHPAALPDDELIAQCTVGKGRSSGPGGQHRNKVETKVILTHEPTGTMAHAGERREATVNRRMAIRRLRLTLATEHRIGVPIGEIGSELWKSRLRPRKSADGTRTNAISCNPEHHDFPSLLAEALDVICDAEWELKKAAIRLETTPSQLIKLVKDHPAAFVKLNAERAKLGKHPIK
ncbi:MAG: peptide chain release factor-like protein [Phycisphaeraceae bacterium]|nr:MAG: peptide chain release factor-like protein [Phycisphaeraceae bacterium]